MKLLTLVLLSCLAVVGCHHGDHDLITGCDIACEDADLDSSGRVDGYDLAVAADNHNDCELKAVEKHFGEHCDED